MKCSNIKYQLNLRKQKTKKERKSFNMLNINIEDDQNEVRSDNLCIRFVRKKFKCIIIFCLLLIVLLEVIKLILEKVDNETIQYLFSNYVLKNTTEKS
jgi:hypothetical protein